MDRTKDIPRPLIICLLIAVATFGAFWPILHNGFINFDDPEYVLENSHVTTGLKWANVAWAFGTHYAGNWHPLTWISHMLDDQVFALNPGGHHFTNLLLHTGNSILLFLALRSMTGTTWRSAFVAALFAVHPLHVESVAWVSERKDVLSAFFFMLTLICYAKYSETGAPYSAISRRAFFYLLSLACFALGLLSKAMLVTTPFLLFVLDFWPLKRFAQPVKPASPPIPVWRLALEKIPFFALAIAASVVTYIVQKKQGSVAPSGLTFESRAANAVLAYGRYLEKTFWPLNLSIFYPHPATTHPELSEWITWHVGLAAIVVLAISVAVVLAIRTRPYLATGWFWYLGTLVPVIGLVQVGGQAMADRYTYIPLIGIFIMLAWLIGDFAKSSLPQSRWVALTSAATLVACLVLTHLQARLWKSSATIFSHALRVTTHNATAHFNYGAALEAGGDIKSAMVHYRQSIEADPFRADAHYNLAHGLEQEGNLPEAEKEYRAAFSLQPDHYFSHNNLGNLLLKTGQLDDAVAQYSEVLRIKPDYVTAHNNLGKAFADLGNYPQSEASYAEALRLDPGSVTAETGLGLALVMQDKLPEAIVHLTRAATLRPDNVEASINLANALFDSGQLEPARRTYAKALQLQPSLAKESLETADSLNAKGQTVASLARYVLALRLTPESSEAQEKLGLFLAQHGNLKDALTNFSEVIRLRPDAQAHYNMALALVALGRHAEAIDHYRQALDLKPQWAAAMNDLAWILATHPLAQLRNGAEAVKLARAACDLAGEQSPQYWGTLDAAYAEAGQFELAIATAQKTRDLALRQGARVIAEAADARLALYRNAQPFRQALAGSQAQKTNP